MKPHLISSTHTFSTPVYSSLPFSTKSCNLSFKNHIFIPLLSSNHAHNLHMCNLSNLFKAQNNPNSITEVLSSTQQNETTNELQFVEIKNPNLHLPSFVNSSSFKFSLNDQAFFLLTFIAFTTSVAFASFVAAAVPTLYAMGRAANSFAKLADVVRGELPGTMASIRLSGMEVSDLTLELSDLSQEISEGVNKSAQAVQAAKVGIQQIGARAREQTILMIEERVNLPAITLRTVVSMATKKTSRAVGRATRAFLNLISGGESTQKN